MPGKPRMLIIDDEKEVGNFFKHLFMHDYDVTIVYSGLEAGKAVRTSFFDLAFVDLKLSDANGLDILSLISKELPYCRVIIMTGYSTVSTAIKAIQQGAFDYIEKPFDNLEYLKTLATRALGDQDGLSLAKSAEEGFVIGSDPAMRNVVSLARKIADKKLTALIEGETGTGKEVLARFIHRYSDRSAQPFLAVNCGAFSDTLLESELFGHEKGSFTGATSARRGIFEMAHRGTLFLDEISEASTATQIKLLRMLENDEIFRIGGERPTKCDVRLIAATNADLQETVKLGRFREDLYFRLNVINLKLPPLRERRADIPLLIDYVTRTRFQKNNTIFSQKAMEILAKYDWPGNVRELVNVVTRVLAVFDGKEVLSEHIPLKIHQCDHPNPGSNRALPKGCSLTELEIPYKVQVPGQEGDLNKIIKEIKTIEADIIRNAIQQAIDRCGGSQSKAASALNITPRRLQYYLNER